VFWTRNTIRKVTIVVPVLMTSFQVSEKPNTGPESDQSNTVEHATAKDVGVPSRHDTRRATSLNAQGLCGVVFIGR
jgi:hypothetical protein